MFVVRIVRCLNELIGVSKVFVVRELLIRCLL